VEINPGYAEAVLKSENARVFKDRRTRIYFDDGRRWLNRNPSEKYDLIVLNTSYHWRSQVTNILSEEFLQMVRAHLKPGGVFYYNTTGLPDIAHTAANVFPHVVQVINFVAASDAPFDLSREERAANLERFVEDGQPTFAASPQLVKRGEELANWPLPELATTLRNRSDLWSITDDNMASEFRAGVRFYQPEKGWGALFARPGS